MKHLFVFRDRDEPKYGLFSVSRETDTRYYFEHVAGSKLTVNFGGRNGSQPGYTFNYHKTYWLTKDDARLRRIGVVTDIPSFVALVESHKGLVKTIERIRDKADRDVRDAMMHYENGVSNIKVKL